MMDEASFNAGVKAMFDALQMRIASNWHPRFEKVCATENSWAHEWALDALEEVSPERAVTWRSLDAMYAEGVEAGKRMRQPLPDNAGVIPETMRCTSICHCKNSNYQIDHAGSQQVATYNNVQGLTTLAYNAVVNGG